MKACFVSSFNYNPEYSNFPSSAIPRFCLLGLLLCWLSSTCTSSKDSLFPSLHLTHIGYQTCSQMFLQQCSKKVLVHFECKFSNPHHSDFLKAQPSTKDPSKIAAGNHVKLEEYTAYMQISRSMQLGLLQSKFNTHKSPRYI